MLLIIPGFYLLIAYTFAIAFVAARNFDFWEALESSRKVITKNWFSFFAFGIVLFLINVVGFLIFGIGLLVTVPVSQCAIAAAFQDIVGLPVSDS